MRLRVYTRTPRCREEKVDERSLLCEIILMTSDTAKLGEIGETQAIAYLHAVGYKLYDRNVRIKRDEIDIIAYDPQEKCIVFAEVKTRKNNHPDYTPLLNLTGQKKEKMRRAAQRWVSLHDYDGSYRIDLICITGGQVQDHFVSVTSDV